MMACAKCLKGDHCGNCVGCCKQQDKTNGDAKCPHGISYNEWCPVCADGPAPNKAIAMKVALEWVALLSLGAALGYLALAAAWALWG